MKTSLLFLKRTVLFCLFALASQTSFSQIIISQYYEGTGTNKWIELTNTSNTAINTASPQLKLGLWAVTGSTGNIALTGAPSSTVNLTVTIPAYGTVLIGNTGNGTEISYLTAASAAMTSNSVINFNGNDGVALLDASNNILDAFGTGVNATDISYVRSTAVTSASSTYVPSQWTSATIAVVQAAGTTDANRLNYQLSSACTAPANSPTVLSFGSPASTSISGSFTATTADEYLVAYSTSASLTASPANGTVYSAGNTFGNATVLSRGTATSFNATSLSSSTTYYFYVFSLNSVGCSGGPAYKSIAPLSGSATTLAPPCVTPANQPTALLFNSSTSTGISGSFTATAADEYLIAYSTSASLTASPANGTVYNAGNTFGNATVLSRGTATSFNATSLASSTTYYFYVFSLNSISCSAGPAYKTASPLSGSATTLAPTCVTPANQPTTLLFNSPTSTSISGSFTATVADEYLVAYSTSASLTALPVNGTIYNAGNTFGNATVLSRGISTTFNATSLGSSTTYYFYVFALNSAGCSAGPVYKTTSPLSGSATTLAPPCATPANQPTALLFNSPTHNVISGSFTAATADAYLVVYSTGATLSASPANGTTYTAGNVFGNATVVSSSAATTFSAVGLTPSTVYYISVFALNNTGCSGGPAYKTTAALSGSATTIAAPLNYYFGNFHSHSEYSDGTGTPAGDFTYGDTANCMDFLGISEHNHVAAGMSLANWSLGRNQAVAATTPTFLAMYGMEWGVISGGGHVLVYGVPNLLGWDAGQYQTYVPQSIYTGSTGLFTTINGFGNNAFATLAHPNNADYNGIMTTYDAAADDAVVGSAVENGPSSSINTTYTDPPSSMLYLSYYRNMLARGYHLGPTIDHDNHNVTHGHTATTRTVVMSPSLTEADILSSMRLMRFYATQDCAAYVTFKVNGNAIGSIVTAAGTPTITVTTSTSSAVTSLKIYSGVAGSGTNATILTSTTTGSITYTHAALANLSSRYYYIDITEADGKRIVTSPIWFTRNDAARMAKQAAIAEFFTIAEPKKVTLKWITTHESADQTFTVEKSTDNKTFQLMETRIGKGSSPFPNNYTTTDVSSQNEGITYYRLTQYDTTGAIAYTETKKVERTIEPQFDVEVFPNPVSDKTTIQLNNTHGETIEIAIFDLTGQRVYSKTMPSENGNQEIALPLQSLKTGVYLLTLRSGNHVVNTKISKL